jgi:mono/diheme cytochrome c family protein
MREHRHFNVRLGALAVGTIFVIAGVFVARDSGVARSAEPSTGPGAEAYAKYCVACHGADGRGAAMKAAMPTIPDFADAAWQDGRNNPELSIGILEGKGTQMPGFNDRLTADQTKDLVALIRGFKKAPANAGTK